MAEIQIPNVRQESTVLLPTRLKDNGVTVNWSSLANIKAYMYSDAQRVIAGKCTVEVDSENSAVLNVTYPATRPQYLGVNSLLVRCKYQGREKTYDVPVLNFVERTADADGVTVLDDPVVNVTLEVNEVSTSLLDGAIAAALDAAIKAEEAAEEAQRIIDEGRGPEGKSAYQVAVDNGFEGTEEEWLESLKGEDGKTPGWDDFSAEDKAAIIAEADAALQPALDSKQNVIQDLTTIRSGAAAGAEASSRPYDSQNPNGMGYLVLEKDKTFAEQVTAANTIYEIRYEFDLNNASVTIPAGCELKFNGGKIDNGTIVVSDTIVDARPVAGFGSGIVVSGVFQNQAVFPEWFGAVGDGQTNDRDAIQKALDVSDNVVGIPGKVYAVATPDPYKHCLTIKRDNQHLVINLKNTDVYDSLDYRGRAVIFCDGKNGFYFRGSITSINDSIPVSASPGITLEWARGGILCYGNCSNFDIELSCANLYSGIASGAFNDQDYIYRNGTTGVSNGRFIVKANRIAYPVAINYGNNNQIDVTGENMHRCVYICGDYNRIVARGKNYLGAAAPAHVILLANFIEDNGNVVLKASNYNDVTYKELEGETNFLSEGSMFAYQVVSTSSNPPDYTHIDYGFIGNTFNAYCVNNSNRSSITSYLFLSPASTWTYDKVVRFDFTLNIYGDATNYVFRGVEFAVAGLLNNIVVNNYTPQKVRFNIADDKSDSLYQIFGNQFCFTKQLSGRLVASGNNVECQVSGASEIVGDVYVHALNPTITITTDYNHKHVHLDSWDYYPAASFRRATPTASQVGVSYFETSTNRPNFWTGSKWVEADGTTGGTRRNGTTAQRPASANISVGFIYFDTDLGKMIVWNGTAWVNMDGTALT